MNPAIHIRIYAAFRIAASTRSRTKSFNLAGGFIARQTRLSRLCSAMVSFAMTVFSVPIVVLRLPHRAQSGQEKN